MDPAPPAGTSGLVRQELREHFEPGDDVGSEIPRQHVDWVQNAVDAPRHGQSVFSGEQVDVASPLTHFSPLSEWHRRAARYTQDAFSRNLGRFVAKLLLKRQRHEDHSKNIEPIFILGSAAARRQHRLLSLNAKNFSFGERPNIVKGRETDQVESPNGSSETQLGNGEHTSCEKNQISTFARRGSINGLARTAAGDRVPAACCRPRSDALEKQLRLENSRQAGD